MSERHPDPELRDALEHFEECLMTPLVPGELTAWSQAAQANWAALRILLQREVRNQHREKLKRIAQNDLDLLPRVVQMSADDQAILDLAQRIGRYVDKLVAEGSAPEPKELKVRDQLRKLVEGGLDLVNLVRIQETALHTWLKEAFKHD